MACCNSTIASGPARAVLYLRMSSDRQETSIGDQRTELRKYAATRGYAIVGEFVDEGISGDSTERRAGFLAMRDAAGSGAFAVVLAWDQDRVGRFDPLDAGYWLYPFRQSGIEFETIAQGRLNFEDLTGQLIFSVNQLGKAQYLRDLSRNTVRGQLASARAGRQGTGGKDPFGYRHEGERVWIVPEEAEIIRWIFARYLEPGSSIRSIASELNARGIATCKGASCWKQGAVRSILTRRKYTGAFVYGGTTSGKYFGGCGGEMLPRKKTDGIANSEPIVHPDRFEAIVSAEVFDRVQEKLHARRQETRPRSARFYVLGGLLRCGDCGGTLGGQQRFGTSAYMCRSYLQGGTAACWSNAIEEAPLVQYIVDYVRSEYCSPEARERLVAEIRRQQGEPANRTGEQTRLRRKVEELNAKIDRGAGRVLDAPAELVPTLYRKLEELKSERDRLTAELEALASRPTRSRQDQDREIEEAMRALDAIEETVAQGSPEAVRELLSGIVSRIVLHYEHGTRGSLRTSRFLYGEGWLRPQPSQLNTSCPCRVQERRFRFTIEDLQRAG